MQNSKCFCVASWCINKIYVVLGLHSLCLRYDGLSNFRYTEIVVGMRSKFTSRQQTIFRMYS